MSVELEDEWLIEKAELVIAVRGYEDEEKQRWDAGIDCVASHSDSDDKVLLRIVTEPKSSSGITGVDIVREMSEAMERKGHDRGVLIGKKFTEGAKKEMRREGIQIVSEKLSPRFEPSELYVSMREYMDDLCKAKCGRAPEKQSDCKGKDSEGHYSCKIRLISDNASFHFEEGWRNLLQRDFERLIAAHIPTNDQERKSELTFS